jgi:heat-inducible transcriptional repressor
VSNERLLMVLSLDGGVVRTVFVEVDGEIADSAVTQVTAVLNERLAGLNLDQIRSSLGVRLRDTAAGPGASELLNIFLQEGEQLFDAVLPLGEENMVLGRASLLAEQPEFSEADRMRRLLALTERPEALADAIRRRTAPGVTITIGTEHNDPRLEEFTVVTAEYHVGTLNGVIGVIGPTRMPYERVISLVSHTSRLLNDLLHQ